MGVTLGHVIHAHIHRYIHMHVHVHCRIYVGFSIERTHVQVHDAFVCPCFS